MKFCPFCGVCLPEGTLSFCPECGKGLPPRAPAGGTVRSRKRPPAAPRRASTEKHPPQRPSKNPQDENYDGYYDDIRPVDAGIRGEGMHPQMLKQIGLIVLGAIGVIGLSILLMYLL